MKLIIKSRHRAVRAARAALDKQAQDVILMDVRVHSGVTDFFLLATASSRRQIAAIAEWVEHELRRCGGRVLHIEGLEEPKPAKRRTTSPASTTRVWPGGEGLSWVLMDCGDLVVHVFNPPAREFYQLERLWADAPRIPMES